MILKKITNEKIHSILPIPWFWSFLSCKELSSSLNVIRIIRNEVPRDLQILVYRDGLEQENLLISSGDSSIVKADCVYELGSLVVCDVIWAFRQMNDSVDVVFEDGKILSYCSSNNCWKNDKNIVNFKLGREEYAGYEQIAEHTYRFTITEEDYALAE